jgi:hypothetical protein
MYLQGQTNGDHGQSFHHQGGICSTTLKKLYFNFLGLAVEDMTWKGLGHLNLRDCAAHRENWEVFRKMINQS